MVTYRIDYELGLVFKVIRSKEVFVCKLTLFRCPLKCKLESSCAKCAGE